MAQEDRPIARVNANDRELDLTPATWDGNRALVLAYESGTEKFVGIVGIATEPLQAEALTLGVEPRLLSVMEEAGILRGTGSTAVIGNAVLPTAEVLNEEFNRFWDACRNQLVNERADLDREPNR
jgi:hypothetical protein